MLYTVYPSKPVVNYSDLYLIHCTYFVYFEGRTELHSILQPFLLRRVKNQVLKDLPNKSEIVLYHKLSPLQKKYYKAILTKDLGGFTLLHHPLMDLHIDTPCTQYLKF